ncbi:MAG: DNA repair protein RecN [Clostridiales bacterium]|nr:DNA repair protein RecN [Clostridiales bacterium]
MRSLYLENIAVIERASIDFEGGLAVLTGETGAGKSIVIDAINMALGERTSRDVIRTGASSAQVTAVFSLAPDGPAARLLAQEGFSVEEDILLERSVNAEGRGSCKIGGRPVPMALLRELGSLLLNIHGQHDNQHLLQPERHIEYLDAFSPDDALLSDYREAYRDWTEARRQLRALEQDEAERTRELELLRFQVEEIEAAELQPGEEQALADRRRLMQNAQKLSEAVGQARQALRSDEGEGALTLTGAAMRLLSEGASLSAQLEALCERLADLHYQLEDLSGELRDFQEGLNFDPAEAEEIELRLMYIGKLRRKYGEDEQQILDYAERARSRLAELNFSQERKTALAQQERSRYNKVQNLAGRLTEHRRACAAQVEAQVERELAFLNMDKTRFVVQILPAGQDVYDENGADEVAFLISPNPGEQPRPLSKIVSGGELSRVMLSLKGILGRREGVETLIFDEIDAGVSGSAAEKIGLKLRALSAERQVLCVTHLPQIASLADHHLLVEKREQQGRTHTSVSRLDPEQRVDELARMISGTRVTEAARRAAREMLEHNRH